LGSAFGHCGFQFLLPESAFLIIEAAEKRDMDNHQFRDRKRRVGASEAFDDISIVSVSNPTAGLRQKTPQIRHAHHFATSRPPHTVGSASVT
jgi:hypothetical protein